MHGELFDPDYWRQLQHTPRQGSIHGRIPLPPETAIHPRTAVIRAVIFDLDETLHQRTPSIAQFAHTLYLELQPAEDESTFVTTFLSLDERGRRPREGLFAAIVERYGFGIDPDALARRFRQTAWREPVLFGDAIVTLRQLGAKGYRTGILTNGSEASQTAKIHNSGLHREVDAYVISGTVKVKKPDIRIFQMMCDKLGVAANECVMVGDSVDHDIRGGANAGMQTLWMVPPDAPIGSLPVGCAGHISRPGHALAFVESQNGLLAP